MSSLEYKLLHLLAHEVMQIVRREKRFDFNTLLKVDCLTRRLAFELYRRSIPNFEVEYEHDVPLDMLRQVEEDVSRGLDLFLRFYNVGVEVGKEISDLYPSRGWAKTFIEFLLTEALGEVIDWCSTLKLYVKY